MRDSLGDLIFQSATTALLENPDVTPPCHTVISGAGGGFIAIVDSFSQGDQSDTVLYTRPFIGNGVMREGQVLPQVPLCPAPSHAHFTEHNLHTPQRQHLSCMRSLWLGL